MVVVFGEGTYAEGEGDRNGNIGLRANDATMLGVCYFD
jgi:hypothetical protein